jgi:hypothetical protein
VEIKSRLKSEDACYHSMQNLLFSSLLSEKIKITLQRTIILPFVLYGCETWSLTLRDERRLRLSESRVLRRVFDHKRGQVIGSGLEITRSSMICTPHQILFEG